jgi:hypothetical protein
MRYLQSLHLFGSIYEDLVSLILSIGGEGVQSPATFGVCAQLMFLQRLYDVDRLVWSPYLLLGWASASVLVFFFLLFSACVQL